MQMKGRKEIRLQDPVVSIGFKQFRIQVNTVMGRAGVMKPPWPLHMEKMFVQSKPSKRRTAVSGWLALISMYVHCMSSVSRKLQAHTKSALQLPPE